MTQRSSATARRDSNTHSSLNTDMREDQDGQTEDDIAAGDYGSGKQRNTKRLFNSIRDRTQLQKICLGNTFPGCRRSRNGTAHPLPYGHTY